MHMCCGNAIFIIFPSSRNCVSNEANHNLSRNARQLHSNNNKLYLGRFHLGNERRRRQRCQLDANVRGFAYIAFSLQKAARLGKSTRSIDEFSICLQPILIMNISIYDGYFSISLQHPNHLYSTFSIFASMIARKKIVRVSK